MWNAEKLYHLHPKKSKTCWLKDLVVPSGAGNKKTIKSIRCRFSILRLIGNLIPNRSRDANFVLGKF